MSKNTPGPWESCAQYVRGPMKDGGFVVAELPVNSGLMEADSRLIAAAPELLEALKDMHQVLLEAMGTGGWIPTPVQASFRAAWADVTAAIAKATGEQP